MKLGITIVTHHKPFLIESSLKSLNTQTYKDFDLNFIFIKGNGLKKTKTYTGFNNLANKLKNSKYQLSNHSNKVLKIIKNYKKTKKVFIYKNNQSLDSGAWIKYISQKSWDKYDFNFFLMEGFLFKNIYALEETVEFLKKNKPSYTMLGSELIYHSRKTINRLVIEPNEKDPNKRNMNIFHQNCINKVFKKFSKINKLDSFLIKWKRYNFFRKKSENDIVINFVNNNYFSFFQKLKFFLKYIIKEKSFLNPFCNKVFYTEGDYRHLIPVSFLQNKLFNKSLYYKNISAHIIKSPYFFVNGCQHIYSKAYLSSLSINIKKHKLVSFVYNTPFSGSALEIIWGILPSVYKVKKWYLDCLHRPRKNFYYYNREDTPTGMKKYLKIYGITDE